MIKETALGKAVLEGVALWATPKERIRVPENAREMTMVMIPKPGRDHSKVKGHRPIVLANTVGKLGEKLIAADLQDMEELWHDRGRKGRGAMDSVMLMQHMRGGPGGKDVYGRDIHSAFNSINSEQSD